jgi:predicted transcriptional regulator
MSKESPVYRNVKALLVKRGITHTQIAKDLGISRAAVSGVLGGLWESDRVKNHIARILNKDCDRLWKKAA